MKRAAKQNYKTQNKNRKLTSFLPTTPAKVTPTKAPLKTIEAFNVTTTPTRNVLPLKRTSVGAFAISEQSQKYLSRPSNGLIESNIINRQAATVQMKVTNSKKNQKSVTKKITDLHKILEKEFVELEDSQLSHARDSQSPIYIPRKTSSASKKKSSAIKRDVSPLSKLNLQIDEPRILRSGASLSSIYSPSHKKLIYQCKSISGQKYNSNKGKKQTLISSGSSSINFSDSIMADPDQVRSAEKHINSRDSSQPRLRKSPSVGEIEAPISKFNDLEVMGADTQVSNYQNSMNNIFGLEESGNPILNQTGATCDSPVNQSLNQSLQSPSKISRATSPFKAIKLGRCIQMEGQVFWEVQRKQGKKKPSTKYELEESLVQSLGQEFLNLKKKHM